MHSIHLHEGTQKAPSAVLLAILSSSQSPPLDFAAARDVRFAAHFAARDSVRDAARDAVRFALRFAVAVAVAAGSGGQAPDTILMHVLCSPWLLQRTPIS